ncbi:MAG: aspartate aminotransferase family protein [Acetobacterium sp.]|nr:aspartate aminotransferase family protein [Bacillota bacterium]MCG2731386.1 aspartate aminotransferase family protein [Acetobacterium sp.]
MNQTIIKAENYFLNTYNRYPIVLESGEGVYLYDDAGKKYLDFAAGIGVFALGYQNKIYNEVLKAQIDRLIHTSNLFYNKPSADAAEKFAKVSGMEKVFFTNSGTEAIEGAIKIARKYYFNKTGSPEGEIIAMEHSFHGRSMGALAVTGQPKYQEAFGPMMPNIKFAQFNNLASVKEQINEKTGAILMETIQGEGGLYPATADFLIGVKMLCEEHDLLLILDEIQCGMGRVGEMFAYQAYGVIPDVITAAKALGCGIPVGAFAARGKAADVLEPGDHGTTYGYNPLAGAAVDVVLDIYEQTDLLAHVKEVSSYLEEKLNELVSDYSCVKERRGKGLMQALELDRPVKEIIAKTQELGLIIITAGPNVLRFLPPLVIKKKQIDEMINILKSSLEFVYNKDRN